jgi:hypothetical protein
MRRLSVLVIVLTVSAWSHAHSQTAPPNELTLQGFLVVGKSAGACGILTQQLTFQETTQMSGGNEFFIRFWTTEAARLGMTLEQYVEHCKTAVSSYGKLWEMADAKP